MTFTRTPISGKIAHDARVYGEDEAVALSTSFANVLEVDMRELKTATIILRLDDVAIDGDYQIFGTCKRNPSSTVTADEWVAEKASTALTHNVNSVDVITKNYEKVIVQAKADSGTPVLKAWYKGNN